MSRSSPRPIERHELKFIIHPRLVPAIRRYIAPFTTPDRYTATQPALRYPICSLYYDSADLRFFRSTLDGERNRVKLRVRCYAPPGGQHPELPTFFEIKRKCNGVVSKRRALVQNALACRLVWGEWGWSCLPTDDHETQAVLNEFFYLRSAYNARPVLNVHYEREAYESHGGGHVRVTMDRGLSGSGRALPGNLEVPHVRSVSVGGVILEIKFSNSYPHWIAAMIRRFDLERCSVPKYILCVRANQGLEYPRRELRPSRQVPA